MGWYLWNIYPRCLRPSWFIGWKSYSSLVRLSKSSISLKIILLVFIVLKLVAQHCPSYSILNKWCNNSKCIACGPQRMNCLWVLKYSFQFVSRMKKKRFLLRINVTLLTRISLNDIFYLFKWTLLPRKLILWHIFV